MDMHQHSQRRDTRVPDVSAETCNLVPAFPVNLGEAFPAEGETKFKVLEFMQGKGRLCTWVYSLASEMERRETSGSQSERASAFLVRSMNLIANIVLSRDCG